MQKKNEEDRYQAVRQVGLLTTIPILLAASPIIGFFMGRFIDGKLGTDPVFSIIFVVLGFIAGAIQVTKMVKRANRDLEKKD